MCSKGEETELNIKIISRSNILPTWVGCDPLEEGSLTFHRGVILVYS